MPVNEIILSHSQSIDIGAPYYESPRGARFMPAIDWTPGDPDPREVAWPAGPDQEFARLLESGKGSNRFVLTSTKRATIKYHLNNPNAGGRGEKGSAALKKDGSERQQALSFFELQDGQVYRRGGINKQGVEYYL